jgi:TrmH family RNA methyltransferase
VARSTGFPFVQAAAALASSERNLETKRMGSVREIGSRQNSLVKEFRAAFRSGRSESGLLALEGPRVIGEALRSSVRMEKVLFSRTGYERHGARLMPQFSKHVELAVVGDEVFRSATDVEHPQGVAALARFDFVNFDELLAGLPDGALLAVAAGVQDPGNLGTLMRAADAFGADAVAILGGGVPAWNPKAVRASAGAVFHLPVASQVEPEALVTGCRARGLRMVATAARSRLAPAAADLRGPLCLLIGGEGSGLPRDLQRAAEITVAIPMRRNVESLNAAVAAAIVLYEAARQRSEPADDVATEETEPLIR